MAESNAWMPLYIGDYLADTMHLNGAQHGAYLLLIMHYWRKGPLPDDDGELAAISRTDRKAWSRDVGPVVRRFFHADDGKLFHKRVENEINVAKEVRAAGGRRGSAGAAAKWGETTNSQTRAQRLAVARTLGRHTIDEWDALVEVCGGCCLKCGESSENVEIVKDHIVPIYQGGSDGIDNLQPLCGSCNSAKGKDTTDRRPPDWQASMQAFLQTKDDCEMPGKCVLTPGQSQSQLPKKERDLRSLGQNGLHDRDFDERFWPLYPRKVGKDAARKAWGKAAKRANPEQIIAGLRLYAFKPDPEFQPHASTWLNEGRWKVEPDTAPPNSVGGSHAAETGPRKASDMTGTW